MSRMSRGTKVIIKSLRQRLVKKGRRWGACRPPEVLSYQGVTPHTSERNAIFGCIYN